MAVWSEVEASILKKHSGRMDAEYFRPEILNAESMVTQFNYAKFGDLVVDGYRVVYENTKILRPDKVTQEDCRFLQAANISQDGLTISIHDLGFVSKNDWERYPKGRISMGEILIEVKGQAEKVTIIPKDYPKKILVSGSLFKATISKDIASEYIFAFFNCYYGKLLRDRTKTNTLIGFVSKPELYKIPVPIPSEKNHELITFDIKESIRLNNLSQSLYAQAQQLLEQELGIDKLEFEKPMGYETSFSEVMENNRADADYYQVKFQTIEKHLSSIPVKKLISIAQFSKGIEVGSSAYTDEGKLFIRVSNVKERGIETGASDKYISNQLFASLKQYQPKKNELLLTKDGTPGTCYVVDEPIDGIISGGIVKINLIDKNNVLPEYLALVINSQICKMQIERDCSGALIVHWKPGDIAKLKVPVLKYTVMKRLSDLVIQSKQAKQESYQLLEKAKARVEQLIEQAAEES